MLTYNEAYAAVLGDTRTVFRARRPGLTGQESTVSITPLEKPGWFMRRFQGRLYLEPKAYPRSSNTFDMDATFYERENRFYDGYFAFESATEKNAYIVCNDTELSVVVTDNTTDFGERASFVFIESYSGEGSNKQHRRRRAAGKMSVFRKVLPYKHTHTSTCMGNCVLLLVLLLHILSLD